MHCEWDEAKNRGNFVKHGLRFEDAEKVLSGPCVSFVDDRFDYGEDRTYAVGLVNGLEITLIHADRKNKKNNDARDNEIRHNHDRRIISAWRSEPHQRRRYWQSLKQGAGK